MHYDDLALKYFYGANPEHRNGQTTYEFNSSSDLLKIKEDGKVIETLGDEITDSIPTKMPRNLTDSRGIDTLDFSDAGSQDMVVDLNPGGWTTFDAARCFAGRIPSTREFQPTI